jgi:hypothetical protein
MSLAAALVMQQTSLAAAGVRECPGTAPCGRDCDESEAIPVT